MDNLEVKAAEMESVAEDRVIQARGVWHRPNVTGEETNLEGICSVLDTLQKTGVNLVFLETFYHGMTMYRSSLIPYYTGFDKFDYSPYPDYLSAFVAEATKRGIEVHAWVEDFYIGVDENYFTKHLSQWLMQTKDGAIRQSEGEEYGGYLFLDPANPDVRQYLVNFYHELLTKFPEIAGLNLDYIRYPVSSRYDDTGYTEVAMNGFAEEMGFAFPENATREEKVAMVAERYNDWVNYRAGRVTTFVGQVYDMVRTQHAGVLLSTAVFPEQGKSFGDKKQDFNTWLARGYLDIITPMAYYDDIGSLKNALEGMLPGLSACYCYAGISPTYHNLSNERVLQQMQTTKDTGADGFVFFGSQSILNNARYIELLQQQFREESAPALLPHAQAQKLIGATAAELEKQLTQAGEPAEKLQSLLQQLQALSDEADDRDVKKMEQVQKQLRLLVRYNLGNFVTEANLDLAKQPLEQLLRYISVKADRLAHKTDPGEETPEPDVPATQPEQTPTEPQQTQPAQPKSANLARTVGLGAAVAAVAAACAACIHAIRKGRPCRVRVGRSDGSRRMERSAPRPD